jgi:hypothetical protein
MIRMSSLEEARVSSDQTCDRMPNSTRSRGILWTIRFGLPRGAIGRHFRARIIQCNLEGETEQDLDTARFLFPV